ncbi:MAG: hypothetical protein H6569_13965 [Lewinellaceae bacterium]|nr:hypothetical protein [Lewinellaceae bacterium]
MNLAQNSGRLILPFFALLASSLFWACDKDTETKTYLPEDGHLVISFTHKFKPADYEEGKRIVVEDFSAAIKNSGQTRRTYFMSNPDSAEVYVISFFQPGSSTTEWLNSDERDAVLQRLYPLYREPLIVEEYTTGLIHDTHALADNTPDYLPEPGDKVMVYNGFFAPGTYDAAVDIVTNDLSEIIENSGQKRRSYHVLNPGLYEVLSLSFFHPTSSVDDWGQNPERQMLADSLGKLAIEPLTEQLYTLDLAHNSK